MISHWNNQQESDILQNKFLLKKSDMISLGLYGAFGIGVGWIKLYHYDQMVCI